MNDPTDTHRIFIKEAAEYLGICERGLWTIISRSRRAAQGIYVEGPTIKFYQAGVRGKIWFKLEWLDDFIRGNTITPIDARPVSILITKATTTKPLTQHEALVRLRPPKKVTRTERTTSRSAPNRPLANCP